MEYGKFIYIGIKDQNFQRPTTYSRILIFQRIDFSQNYGNTDIINLIDTSYVKSKNTVVLEWLHSMMEVIFIIASKDANLNQATLWIPKQYLSDSIYFLMKEITGQLTPQVW